MPDEDVRLKDVFLVQLVYFTRTRPGSEFRLFAPSDSWLSKGVSTPMGLTASLNRNTAIETIDDPNKWVPKTLAETISRLPDSLAIARAVLWDVPGDALTPGPDLGFGGPYEDEQQPSKPFWLIDLRARRLLSFAESLDQVRADFEVEAKRLRATLDRTT